MDKEPSLNLVEYIQRGPGIIDDGGRISVGFHVDDMATVSPHYAQDIADDEAKRREKEE